ncbi:MAG TPA: hypothetical protein VNT42_09250 [Sphingomonas sp.]|nr:hypothetical protein [Sphingomonas sp.]
MFRVDGGEKQKYPKSELKALALTAVGRHARMPQISDEKEPEAADDAATSS